MQMSEAELETQRLALLAQMSLLDEDFTLH